MGVVCNFMRHFAIFILILLGACKDKTSKTIAAKPKATIIFSTNFTICDTCQMTILVHHEECTTCGEITVDSGAIYLTKDLLKSINELVVNLDKLDSFTLSPNYISLHELFFADKNYFCKLWADTIDFKDLHKAFRLSGKVVKIKRRVLDNGVNEIYPSLFFKVDKAVQVHTSYFVSPGSPHM